jgi:transposase, IS6 family
MINEHGLSVDHTTIFRWVQKYAPEINKRIRPHLKLAGAAGGQVKFVATLFQIAA